MSEHLGRKKTDADYGLGEHTLDMSELSLVSAEELTRRLVGAFESPNYSPPRLPSVATELLSLSQNPDVEFSEIEALLERDAMLAGEILSLARSAFYSRARQVDSMRAALVLIGLTKLQQVVLQAAMDLRVFRSDAYAGPMERLRHHARATAHLSRIISMYTPMAEEQAFLCGLLHDVGIAGILLVLGDAGRGQQPPDLTAIWPAIDGAHAKAGTRMVELWGLPAEYAMVVGAHHQVLIEGYPHPLAATVCLAEELSKELDFALAPKPGSAAKADGGLLTAGNIDSSTPATLDTAREALGLTDQVLELIRKDAEQWAASDRTAVAG